MAIYEMESYYYEEYWSKAENESFYQLIDPFTLFSIRFIQNRKFDAWKSSNTEKME